MPDRMKGVVKWFSKEKGYGFITPDGSQKDVFVHFSGIDGTGYKELKEDERVEFGVEDSAKGPRAVAVSRI